MASAHPGAFGPSCPSIHSPVDSIAVSAGIEMAAVVMMVPAVGWIVPSRMESRNPQNRWVQVLATIDRAQ